jgi:hypothetical protein
VTALDDMARSEGAGRRLLTPARKPRLDKANTGSPRLPPALFELFESCDATDGGARLRDRLRTDLPAGAADVVVSYAVEDRVEGTRTPKTTLHSATCS